MPTIMTMPMRDMTFSEVSVNRSVMATPINPVGTASRMMKGSMNDLNCATRIR